MAEAKKSAAKSVKTAAKKAPAKAAAKKAPTKSVAKKAEPSRQQIAELAHKYWMERGGHHGSDAQDWLRAEKELRG